jgi:ribosomal protein S18 acetylase RimI-like enzyme
MRLKDIAGWNQTAEDWTRLLTANPQGCFAAESEGNVVGTVTTIVYEDRFAWVGMVLVEPEHRGKGLGTRLLQRAVAHLDSRGVACVKLDATPNGKPLYEKLGFVGEYEIERWMLRREPGNNVSEQRPVDMEDALKLDREIFGADRSSLLRSLDKAAPEFTMVRRAKAGIAGYAFGRRGSLADQLGPWTAVNEDVSAGILDEFLRRSSRDLVFIDFLLENPWALPLLQARGFELSRPLTRMFRGTNEHAGRPELLCAILGPEFG